MALAACRHASWTLSLALWHLLLIAPAARQKLTAHNTLLLTLMALADNRLMLANPAPRTWPLLPTAPDVPKSSDPPALPLMHHTCCLLAAANGPPSLHGALLLPLMALDSSCLLPPALGPLAPRSPWVPAAHPWPFAMPTHAITQGLPKEHAVVLRQCPSLRTMCSANKPRRWPC